jgi:hypothetical protein
MMTREMRVTKYEALSSLEAICKTCIVSLVWTLLHFVEFKPPVMLDNLRIYTFAHNIRIKARESETVGYLNKNKKAIHSAIRNAANHLDSNPNSMFHGVNQQKRMASLNTEAPSHFLQGKNMEPFRRNHWSGSVSPMEKTSTCPPHNP